MIDSAISTQHHFWILVFKTHSQTTINKLVDSFSESTEYCEMIFKNKRSINFHCQRKIKISNKREVGMGEFLLKNKTEDPSEFWYDFYIGEFDLDKTKLNYLCYPYKALERKIKLTIAPWAFGTASYYVPQIEEILSQMQTKKGSDRFTYIPKNLLFTTDIVKYVANVSDRDVVGSADKVQITGKNPLESKVFKELYKRPNEFGISTSSLKLRCKLHKIPDENNKSTLDGEIGLLFDHLGNYRFWIPIETKYFNKSKTLKMINLVINFFNEINGLSIEDETSSLEDITE